MAPIFSMIKLLVSMAGSDGSAHQVNEVVTLDSDYEKRLIDSGQAERVEPPKAKTKAKK